MLPLGSIRNRQPSLRPTAVQPSLDHLAAPGSPCASQITRRSYVRSRLGTGKRRRLRLALHPTLSAPALRASRDLLELQRIDSWLRRRLRQVRWIEWKRPKARHNLMNRRMRGPHFRWCGRGRADPALYPVDPAREPGVRLAQVGGR